MTIEESRTGGAMTCRMEEGEGALHSPGVLDTLAGTLSCPACTPTTLDTPCRADWGWWTLTSPPPALPS